MRKVPERPKTKMEILRETNMPEYVRIIQSKRISDMEQKYIDDACKEEPKLPYIPSAFTVKSNFLETDSVRKELNESGWNYHNGEFLHPYTSTQINTVHERLCDGGRILVPGYEDIMDDKGVSSNIMNADNIPQYFSENTYVTRMNPGTMTYRIERHNFNDFWNTRRGKRTDKKYAYMEKRRKRKEEFEKMKRVEEKKQREYDEAKKTLSK